MSEQQQDQLCEAVLEAQCPNMHVRFTGQRVWHTARVEAVVSDHEQERVEATDEETSPVLQHHLSA